MTGMKKTHTKAPLQDNFFKIRKNEQTRKFEKIMFYLRSILFLFCVIAFQKNVIYLIEI